MAECIPETPPDFEHARVVERPDGFYWQSVDSGDEFGPFPTLVAAVDDMDATDDKDFDGVSIADAEDEIGVAGWIDPDTGELAEGPVPRLEDH